MSGDGQERIKMSIGQLRTNKGKFVFYAKCKRKDYKAEKASDKAEITHLKSTLEKEKSLKYVGLTLAVLYLVVLIVVEVTFEMR